MAAEHLVVIGDCRRMKEVKTASVQLILTSPPSFAAEAEYNLCNFELYLRGMQQVFSECSRVLQSGRCLCLNFSDSAEPYSQAHLSLALKRAGFQYCDDLLWRRPSGHFERTLVFLKGKPDYGRLVSLDESLSCWPGQVDAADPFPQEIIESLICRYTFEHELVLDPFLGSGATSKVANQLNRRSIGYASEPNSLPFIRKNIAESRLKVVFRGEGD